MPLWGIGESRTVALIAGNGLRGEAYGTIERAPDDGPHMEFPTWLKNVDEEHGDDRQGDFGEAVANFTTTTTSGATDGVDEMGDDRVLETDRSAADFLNQTVVRGGAGRVGADRLTEGSRGQGFHYEYEYIDGNGNHRRRHECLVAISSSTKILDSYSATPTIVNLDFTHSVPADE